MGVGLNITHPLDGRVNFLASAGKHAKRLRTLGDPA
jgi:hypothetical protein